MDETDKKLKQLHRFLVDKRKVAVAFSGGVDSSLLLKVAHDILKENVLAITISSPAHSKMDIAAAKDITRNIGVMHIIIASNELEKNIAENPINRCYLCKKAEFTLIREKANELGYRCIIEGTNSDDLSDYRPGIKALEELNIYSPLKDMGFTKAEIRQISKRYNLPTWNKPSNPCLMSRFPYGAKITRERLKIIEKAENYLEKLGLTQKRVRFHDDIARIEIPKRDFPILMKHAKEITNYLKKIGFKYVTLDIQGFRSGSMNEVLE